MNNVNKHLIISGHVQGVGFRYFTYRNAKELRIKGWVKNLRDGTVETVLSGSPEGVEKMIKRLQVGPPPAKVGDIREVNEPVNAKNLNDFSIRR